MPATDAPLTDLDDAARELDEVSRPEMAFDPPALSVPVAAWGISILHVACRALVFRDMDARAVRGALSRPCPQPTSPQACYSADLALRYLPDVIALARGIAPDDPLVGGLMDLARQWPLSSVGVTNIGDVDVAPFIDHPSLRQLYVDRIIERADVGRVSHPLVGESVRASLGGFPRLAPKVAEALK